MQLNNTSSPQVTMRMTPPGPAHCDDTDRGSFLLMPAVYSIVFCLGLPGNALALLVLYKSGCRLKAAMKVYLLNLTAADALFNLTLPLWAAYYAFQGDWPFLEPACRLFGSLYYVSTYCSISFMTIISINRYRTLTLSPPRLPMLQRRGAAWVSALTWLIWMGCAVPFLATPQSRMVAGRVNCFQDVDPRFALMACIFFTVSVSAVLASYILILVSLGVHPTKQGAHRRRAKAVVLGMLLVFLVCVLPYHVTLGAWALQWPRPSCPSLAHRLSTALLSISSCLDPFIYCFSLRQFRSGVQKVLHLRSARGVPTITDPLGGHNRTAQRTRSGQEQKSSTKTTSS